MKAVHFGAGNIGRGFVGLLLHEGGYELVFSDVAAPLVDAINAESEYTVHEVGEGGRDTSRHRLPGDQQRDRPRRARRRDRDGQRRHDRRRPDHPEVRRPAHRRRARAARPVVAAAADHGVRERDQRDRPAARRGDGAGGRDAGTPSPAAPSSRTPRSTGSCPAQPAGAGVDVTVEPFFEWAIERPPFGDDPPRIPGAHFVDDLAPYIERKLFTVNTGHATTAYFGAAAGVEKISDALADPAIAATVSRDRSKRPPRCWPPSTGSTRPSSPTYRATILERFRNPAAARHRVARRAPAAAQALAARALRRPRRRSRRARPLGRRAGRRDGRRRSSSTTRRTSSPSTCSG